MYQFFIEQRVSPQQLFPIPSEDYHHIYKVLRLKKDQAVYVVDSSAQRYLALLRDKNYLIKEKITTNHELRIDLNLILALSTKENFEFSLQKAVELGVKNIIVINSRYSMVKLKDVNKKMERWKKIIKAAAMQSKRNLIPQIEYLELNQLWSKEFDLKYLAYENQRDQYLITQNIKDAKSVAIVIGSEGGFDAQEVSAFINHNYQIVGLTNTILRAETAVIYALVSLVNKIMEVTYDTE